MAKISLNSVSMSTKQLFLNAINALEEKELYQFAKLYLKEVEGIEDIVICNGPWDSGIDLRSGGQFYTQYQATVEKKNFETKLNEDLKKAQKNVKDHGLSNKVNYFYSQNLSNTSIISFKKNALKTFSLNLTLLEANTLGEIALSYDKLAELLVSLNPIPESVDKNQFFSSIKAKAFYDFMSFGKSNDIKFNIVKSYLLNYLCSHSNVNRNILLTEMNDHFGSKIKDEYFQNILNKLSTERKILIIKDQVQIREEEKTRLSSLLSNFKLEEASLIIELDKEIKRYPIQVDINQVIDYMIKIYESSYSINLGEFNKRSFKAKSLKESTNELVKFLKANSKENIDFDDLVKNLVRISDQGDLLSKIAAGQVYAAVSDPERLQQYIDQNINNKEIFLDTNVVKYLILAHYNEKIDFADYHLNVARQFINFARENDLKLKMIKRYVWETRNLFNDALNLIPFSKLPSFDSLGVSSNIIYNFFIFLRDNDHLDEEIKNFKDFMAEFHFKLGDGNNTSSMEYLLRSLDIEIEEIKDYDAGQTVKIITDEQRKTSKNKSESAIYSDAAMFNRLGDSDVDVNPLDPIFCTWDFTLNAARQRYIENFKGCTQWLMFTPPRLIDHFAMMNFQIKPGTVSNEVLSILHQEYDFKHATQSLIDSLVVIINPNDEIGLLYTNKLGKFREAELANMGNRTETRVEATQDSPPTDKIFNKLMQTYYFSSDEQTTKNFKGLFTMEKYFDEFFEIILNEKNYISLNGKFSNQLISKMDVIIKKSSENTK